MSNIASVRYSALLSKSVRVSALFAAFALCLCAAQFASAQTTFSNSANITIRDATTASPYPANITTSGFPARHRAFPPEIR